MHEPTQISLVLANETVFSCGPPRARTIERLHRGRLTRRRKLSPIR